MERRLRWHYDLVILPNGVKIHFDEPRQNKRVRTTCTCGKSRYIQVCAIKAKGFTGLCQICCNYQMGKKYAGQNHHRWKGGIIKDKSGYITIHKSLLSSEDLTLVESDINNSGYVREHRLVAARIIGRALLPREKVHHLNGIKHDNRSVNLKILSASNHIKEHLDWISTLRNEVARLQNLLDSHQIEY